MWQSPRFDEVQQAVQHPRLRRGGHVSGEPRYEHLSDQTYVFAIDPARAKLNIADAVVPPGQYLVLDDNRKTYRGSWEFGTINTDQIVGEVTRVCFT